MFAWCMARARSTSRRYPSDCGGPDELGRGCISGLERVLYIGESLPEPAPAAHAIPVKEHV